MGCLPGKELNQDLEGRRIANKEDGDESMLSNRPSLLIKRETLEEEMERIKMEDIDFEDVNWSEELQRMVQASDINSLFDKVEDSLKEVREREGMKVFLKSEKEKFKLGMKCLITKDMNLGSVHEYYNTNEVPFYPEDFIYYNLFQSKEDRKKIDKKCKVYDVLAVHTEGDITYFLIHSLIDGYLMLKGKETFYIKAVKKEASEDGDKFTVVQKSVEHFTLPEKEDYKRIDILEVLGCFIYKEDDNLTKSEFYTKVVPKTKVGAGLLKPFLNKYNKDYIKNTVDMLNEFKQNAGEDHDWKRYVNRLANK